MKYAFIINPIAGSINKNSLVEEIKAELQHRNLEFEFHYSEFKGHSIELAKKLRDNANTTIVAIGGDGTVNEIGSQLINSNTTLGLIPLGSGNGLARHLKLPLHPMKALAVILEGNSAKIDAGKLNEKVFFVTCGFGFDAEVAHNFNQRNSRGLIGYVKEVIKLFPYYTAKQYRLEYDGILKSRTAFNVTVANASQYGNDAFIAKDASVQDGLLDLCVIKSYPKLFGPHLGISLFLNNLHNSSFYRAKTVASVKIELENNTELIHAQIDGEALDLQLPARVECLPKALHILVPKNWM